MPIVWVINILGRSNYHQEHCSFVRIRDKYLCLKRFPTIIDRVQVNAACSLCPVSRVHTLCLPNPRRHQPYISAGLCLVPHGCSSVAVLRGQTRSLAPATLSGGVGRESYLSNSCILLFDFPHVVKQRGVTSLPP